MKLALEFGMNIHNDNYPSYPASDLEKNIKSCKELGMDAVRFNQASVDMKGIEEIKKVSDLCHANGMKLMLVVDTKQYETM